MYSRSLFVVEEITEIKGSILDTDNVRHFTPEDFFIVPNLVESEFAKQHPDRIYLTHDELRICFGNKPTKEDLDALLLVKQVFHPAKLVKPQRKPTHLHH